MIAKALSAGFHRVIQRLRPFLRDLVLGGAPTSLTADIATKTLSRLRPTDAVTIERKHVARPARRRDPTHRRRPERQPPTHRDIVDASGTSLLDTFGISHVLAAKILGHTGPIDRFPTADAYANYAGMVCV